MLRDSIGDDMRAAMKSKDPARVSALRMLMTAIKNTEVERGHALSDDEVVEVITKEAKRRRESIDAFRDAGRTDLVDKEEAELAVFQPYLPEQLSDEQLGSLVDEAIAETGASNPTQMGQVMKAVMPKVKGRADGSQVSAMVKQRLGA